jgi:uncharacterized membrane-anchored protein
MAALPVDILTDSRRRPFGCPPLNTVGAEVRVAQETTTGVATAAAKVPEITVLFWVIKVLTTGMGETASDFLAHASVPLAALVGSAGIVAGLWLQLRTTRYEPGPYWFAVAMVAVFGTLAADGFHRVLGVPYWVTTAAYTIAVVVVFAVWDRSEGTLSIHSIVTRRREVFYWVTVLATFALGTAAGDLTAFTFHFGFFTSAVFFAAVIAIPAIAWWRGWLHPIAAFWFAYVITRPLGASVADWLGKPRELTGLGYGDGRVTVAAAALIVMLVVYVARTNHGVQTSPAVAVADTVD